MGTVGATPLGRLNPGTVPPEAPVLFDSPAEERRLEFVLGHSLGEHIKRFPCRGMNIDFEIVKQGDQSSRPIHGVQRQIEVRFLAEDGKYVASARLARRCIIFRLAHRRSEKNAPSELNARTIQEVVVSTRSALLDPRSMQVTHAAPCPKQ